MSRFCIDIKGVDGLLGELLEDELADEFNAAVVSEETDTGCVIGISPAIFHDKIDIDELNNFFKERLKDGIDFEISSLG